MIDKKLEKETEKKRIKKRIMIERVVFGLIILAVIGGFIFAAVKLKNNSSSSSDLSINAIALTDQIKGNREAKTILIEYSDFQCPACAVYAPIIKQIVEEFNDKIVFAYRHFPLSQHKNAEIAAIAAEASGKQGKFWEMHDIIFENQNEWADSKNAKEIFIKYAEKIELNTERFKIDLELKELKEKTRKDLNSGISARVNSTPTFFLNGERVQPQSYEDFKQIIIQKNVQ